MKFLGCDLRYSARRCICYGDSLNLDSILADDPIPRLHGVECACAAGGVLYEEETDLFSIGGPGDVVDGSGDVGELARLARLFRPDEDLGLAGVLRCAVGGVCEGLSVGRPDRSIVTAVAALAGGTDSQVVGGIGDVAEVKPIVLAAADGPCDDLAVRRDGRHGGSAGFGEGLKQSSNARIFGRSGGLREGEDGNGEKGDQEGDRATDPY